MIPLELLVTDNGALGDACNGGAMDGWLELLVVLLPLLVLVVVAVDLAINIS